MVALTHFLSISLTLASTTLAYALPTNNATFSVRDSIDLSCGNGHPSIASLPGPDESLLAPGQQAAGPIYRVVPIYWNVIHADETFQGGKLPQQAINAAIGALNRDFDGSGLAFRLGGFRYIPNADWFVNVDLDKDGLDNKQAKEMKNQLRYGSSKDLNIYSVGFTNSNLGGYATFPWWYANASKMDGVVFKWNTVPGGTLANYNLGKILSHEVGHWSGLYHTFQGGCDPNTGGDFVQDTPAEASPATGCPRGRDTCPGDGPDPIFNHMDYTYDTCKQGPFTQGQAFRMYQAMNIFRAN